MQKNKKSPENIKRGKKKKIFVKPTFKIVDLSTAITEVYAGWGNSGWGPNPFTPGDTSPFGGT